MFEVKFSERCDEGEMGLKYQAGFWEDNNRNRVFMCPACLCPLAAGESALCALTDSRESCSIFSAVGRQS